MFLRQNYNKATGRTYLVMVQSYREKGRKNPTARTIESFGYLDELEKIYDDPINHFKNVVRERNLADKQDSAEYTISALKTQTLEPNTCNRKNYGYIVILKLLHQLGIDRFLINRQQRNTGIGYNTGSIMNMLVISRILSPSSKKKAFEKKSRYFDFEKENVFSLQDVYRSLSHFAGYSNDIQQHIHNRITKNYGRNTDRIYYDVTNYYFEIEQEDGLRKKGVSKEHRPDPIVQMGLAVDSDGVPISYEMFPGNESEKLHLRPMISKLVREFDTGRVIAVADSAQNTGNNIYYLDQGKQGYVFSQSIRGGSADFKKYVVDENGYEWFGDEYKRKSRIERRELLVDFKRPDGTEHKKTVLADQRQIVFYSEKYAARAKMKREAAIQKARKIIENPSAYTRATSYGALKYVQNIEVDKKTGEIKPAKAQPCFNTDQIREDEKYDGYYCIVTNLFDDGKNKGQFDDGKIIDIYRGLWRIEDSFRVTKSELETRPVYLSREDRINAHFLICFISLVILRLIQKKTGYRHSPEKLIEAMNSISCSHESGNLFLFDYRDEVSDDLGNAFGFDFTRRRMTRKEIKNNLGDAKKR